MLARMTALAQRKRQTFGPPIVTIVMRRDAYEQYRAEQPTAHQADLDAMIEAGTLVLSEPS